MALADVLTQSAAVDTALANLKTALDARQAAATATDGTMAGRVKSDEGLLYALAQAGLTPYFPRLADPSTKSTLAAWDARTLAEQLSSSAPILPYGSIAGGLINRNDGLGNVTSNNGTGLPTPKS